jgi:alcohol dehydrogenase class IV
MSHNVPNRNWSYPTAIKFGVGRISELAEHCQGAGLKKPLLVTDKALASCRSPRRAGGAEGRGPWPAVFSEVDPNPNEINMAAGIAVYLAGGHDGVICFGGGSALGPWQDDCADGASAEKTFRSGIWRMSTTGTPAPMPAKIAPIIAVPTTAGTGSEVGRAGVLTNSATHKKKIIFHPKLMPAVTICDPALTVGMPKFITAGTGMDALAHCLEAYSSALLSPDEPGHRAGRHAAGVREPAQGLCQPQRS